MASKQGGQTSQPLQLVRICIYSDVCHNDFHFPSIFYLFFFKQDTPFPCFLASENFRRVAGSCFQHFFHIYKDWEPSVGWFVYECTSQSFKSCAEDGGRRRRGPDSALIINSGETAAERTGTCHVVPRCTAPFTKPCINIRPCKNCWKIAAQMPRKKMLFSCIMSAVLKAAPLGYATTENICDELKLMEIYGFEEWAIQRVNNTLNGHC